MPSRSRKQARSTAPIYSIRKQTINNILHEDYRLGIIRYALVQKVCEDNKKIYRDVLIYRSDYKLTPLDRLFIDELNQARKNYL